MYDIGGTITFPWNLAAVLRLGQRASLMYTAFNKVSTWRPLSHFSTLSSYLTWRSEKANESIQHSSLSRWRPLKGLPSALAGHPGVEVDGRHTPRIGSTYRHTIHRTNSRWQYLPRLRRPTQRPLQSARPT